MGSVYLAEQEQPIRRKVALKVVKLGMDTKEVIARFESERQALAMMNHPNIAQVHDAGTTERGAPYFVMEHVAGIPITDYCDKHRLSTRERLEIFIPVCQAIQHAHQKGIIHRDIKPSNVLVAVQDGKPVPKIIDFGVAKATNQRLTEKTVFTQQGYLIGTPEYMSPEQAEMTGLDVDTTTDIYSLGVLLYQLLVGALPFDAGTLRRAGYDEIRRMIREEEPPKPTTRLSSLGQSAKEIAERRRTDVASLTKDLRGDLEWVTMKAMEKDRTRRYASSSELAADIERHLKHEPVIACPPSSAYRVRKFVRRHRMGVGIAAASVLVLIAFAVTTAMQARRIARERDRGNREAVAAKQVSEFLVGLFNVSDPSEAKGRTITARDILSTGAAKIDQSLHDQPEIQARLKLTIGNVYTNLGLFQEAEPFLLQSVDTYRRAVGDDHPETLAAISALADLYFYRSNFKVAEPLYLEVVRRTEQTFGKEHQRTQKAWADLGGLLCQEKRFAEAEHLLLKTIQVQQRVLGEEHLDTLESMNNLAASYVYQKRFVDALPIALKVYETDHRVLGAEHPTTLGDANNLANIYKNLGRVDEAEAIYVRTIAGEQRVLGENIPPPINRNICLADFIGKRGRTPKPNPYY